MAGISCDVRIRLRRRGADFHAGSALVEPTVTSANASRLAWRTSKRATECDLPGGEADHVGYALIASNDPIRWPTSAPTASAISSSSITSIRRSPLSIFDTKDWGRRSRKANWTWVSPAASRASVRSWASRAYLGDERDRGMPHAWLFSLSLRSRFEPIPKWDIVRHWRW